MKATIIALAAGLLLASNAHAGDSLSCQIKKSAAKGTAFSWSYAHGGAEGPDTIQTSIGTIGYAEGPSYTSLITLEGKPVALPHEHAGLIRFGKVFEHGQKVALAYLVERERDSSASPSELVFLLDKSGVVSQISVQPGNTEPVAGHCDLMQ
jgi:hypothetical protein